jgi:HK97 gp10 family phage protein
VDYARFPEYGTRFMAAQRYMSEAAAAATPGVIAAMAAVYKAAIG